MNFARFAFFAMTLTVVIGLLGCSRQNQPPPPSVETLQAQIDSIQKDPSVPAQAKVQAIEKIKREQREASSGQSGTSLTQ